MGIFGGAGGKQWVSGGAGGKQWVSGGAGGMQWVCIWRCLEQVQEASSGYLEVQEAGCL